FYDAESTFTLYPDFLSGYGIIKLIPPLKGSGISRALGIGGFSHAPCPSSAGGGSSHPSCWSGLSRRLSVRFSALTLLCVRSLIYSLHSTQ
ncbi:MAG: hypothetical protein RMY34_32330, partial [Aulosira sp. DedQUE10]|nr:hypothetical protein [Aulosira sp. DedQUE10]